MKITRNTEVVSVSLPKAVAQKLTEASKKEGRTKSGLIAEMLRRYLEDIRWERIYRRGEETARRLNLTSEEDIDRILHAR